MIDCFVGQRMDLRPRVSTAPERTITPIEKLRDSFEVEKKLLKEEIENRDKRIGLLEERAKLDQKLNSDLVIEKEVLQRPFLLYTC